MEHTLRPQADYIPSMGVFMTASEANRQRVLRLLRFEREQMWAQFTTVDKESPAVKRGKPPMSETRQLWSSDPSSCNISQCIFQKGGLSRPPGRHF